MSEKEKTADSLIIGLVDEVNGLGTEEIRDYTPPTMN